MIDMLRLWDDWRTVFFMEGHVAQLAVYVPIGLQFNAIATASPIAKLFRSPNFTVNCRGSRLLHMGEDDRNR